MKYTKLTIGLMVLMLLLAVKSSSLAQQSTPDASPSGTISPEEVTENVKERIKKVVTEQNGKVENEPRAVVGTLQSVANGTLTIKTKTGVRLASVTEDTTFVQNPGSKKATREDLAIDDFIIAMGYLGDDNVLAAERVVMASEAPATPAKKVGFGRIKLINLDDDELTILLADGSELTVTLSKTTEIQLKQDGELTTVEADVLVEGQTLLVIYMPAAAAKTKVDTALVILADSDVETLPEVAETEDE